MYFVNLLSLVVVITFGFCAILPLIHAYPQPIRNSLQERYSVNSRMRQGHENPMIRRSKRSTIFDEIAGIGKSVINFGETVIENAKTKFSINNAKHYFFKDGERTCRRLKGGLSDNNLLCIENLGNSLILSTLGTAIQYVHDAVITKPTTTTTTTTTTTPRPLTTNPPPNMGTVNIDVIFALPAPTTAKPTTTVEPFDWPKYFEYMLDLIKKDIVEYGEAIKSEVNKLVDRAADSDVATSVKIASKSIEQIESSIETVSKNIQDVVKSIDSMNKNIEGGAKTIETSIEIGAKSIGSSLDSNTKSIGTFVDSGVKTIDTSIEKNTKTIEEAIDKVSLQLNMISELLNEMPPEIYRRMDDIPGKIENLLLQSEMLKTIKEILENIRTHQLDKLKSDREELAMQVAKLAKEVSKRKTRDQLD